MPDQITITHDGPQYDVTVTSDNAVITVTPVTEANITINRNVDGVKGDAGNTVWDLTVEPPPAELGQNGDFAIAISTYNLYYKNNAGVWSLRTNLVGPQGPAGADGATGVDGRTIYSSPFDPPVAGLGQDGDFAITSGTNKLYLKGLGVWIFQTNLVGPQGPVGADGPAGPGVAAGGTTGQQLAKRSAADYDTEWVDPAAGGLENNYGTIALMLADQGNQNEDGMQVVLDASADVNVDVGYAYYQKLNTTTGQLTDYRLISKQEIVELTLGGDRPYIQLALGVAQNVGGATSTQHKFTWTVQEHIDTDYFAHDTVTDNDNITIQQDGWYTIYHNFFATQTGANRTTQIARLWVDGVIDPKFLPVTYGRGATFGVYIGYQCTYRRYFTAGQVLEIGVQVSDPDQTSATNASITATYVQIVIDPQTLPGPKGDVGPQGLPGGAPTTIADTGSVIAVDNIYGDNCNMLSPNTNTSFTLGSVVENGWSRVLIDTTGAGAFPTIAGATISAGHAFITNTLYDMFVEHVGGVTRYSFIEFKPAPL